jgi:hypothetical protein
MLLRSMIPVRYKTYSDGSDEIFSLMNMGPDQIHQARSYLLLSFRKCWGEHRSVKFLRSIYHMNGMCTGMNSHPLRFDLLIPELIGQ